MNSAPLAPVVRLEKTIVSLFSDRRVDGRFAVGVDLARQFVGGRARLEFVFAPFDRDRVFARRRREREGALSGVGELVTST